MNIKVLCIDEGHTLSGSDYGATGNGLYESIETRELGALVKKYCIELGIQVDKCTIDYANSVADSITKRLAIANSKAYDLVLIIHFNSFSDTSANGCEVFILPNKNGYYRTTESYNINLKYAEEILSAVCNAGGFYKRGVKFRDDLGMLLNTKSYAVYLEVCFLTNKSDADKYKTNKDKIARAIAETITGKKIIAKPQWKQDSKGWWYDLGNGKYPKGEWRYIDGEYYYFDEKGYAVRNKWLKLNGYWYYFKDNCAMAKNEWIYYKNNYYYMLPTGKMAEEDVFVDGKWYSIKKTGERV